MMIIGGLTAIGVGILCFTDSDLAWRLYEMDCQQWGQKPIKTNNRRELVHTFGVTIIILGIFAILMGIEMLAAMY